jgi:rhombotail lipoprotein
MSRRVLALPLSALLLVLAGCVGSLPATRRVNSALDFLYPEGLATPRPASEVTLRLPLRVGIAFAPGRQQQMDPISEGHKRRLLEEVAAAFRANPAVGQLVVIPSAYLQPGGSFTNLDRLRSSLGLDLVALVSYDQAQFTESTRASWSYLTVVGALLIDGERNDTRTVMDAVVYDIPSRALLFRAAGESTVKGRSGPYTVARKRRLHAVEGFERATESLIENLRSALEEFDRQARSGTVQGPGTPAVAMYDRQGARIGTSGAGAGALGAVELVAAALLLAALASGVGRRRRARG